MAGQLTGFEIDVYREGMEEDVELTEFSDEIEGWVIEEFQKVGLDTAKSVLELDVAELIKRTDLEDETIEEVLKILKKKNSKNRDRNIFSIFDIRANTSMSNQPTLRLNKFFVSSTSRLTELLNFSHRRGMRLKRVQPPKFPKKSIRCFWTNSRPINPSEMHRPRLVRKSEREGEPTPRARTSRTGKVRA